ncbi:RrF2 family transcriptional regulator [Rubritalea spongiae]|uniref:RrF2 family transcriptional regulator n=1 Tax=Rubritalea spongiae TaxID=430797 RepID=A0ABW5E617_9BACT
MKLTASSDFAYRMLIYVTTHPDRLVTVKEIADAYQLSHNHLAKISKLYIKHGILDGQRGRGGGITLAKDPKDISLGDILRVSEPSPTLIDCKNGLAGPCIILPACTLKGIFAQARSAFYQVLDQHSLYDIAAQPQLAASLNKIFEK